MHTLIHLIIGFLAAWYLELTGMAAVLFILASILIDLDHVFDRAQKNKTTSIKELLNPFVFARTKNYVEKQQTLHVFHTFEFMITIYVAAAFFPVIFTIANSFLLHILFDAWGNVWNRNFGKVGTPDWIKYWTIYYYIKRKSIHT